MKLDASFRFHLWFFFVCAINDYRECPCVGEQSPVTLRKCMCVSSDVYCCLPYKYPGTYKITKNYNIRAITLVHGEL